MRQAGTVKWFSDLKGYGFIVPHSAGTDVFVHRTGIQDDPASLQEHDTVEFEIEAGPQGRLQAVRVEIVARMVRPFASKHGTVTL